MLVPSEEARINLLGVPLETFEGHEGLFLTVVSPQGRHNMAELLRPYRERFAQEPAEQTAAHAPGGPGAPARLQGALPAQGPDGAAHVPRARPLRDAPGGQRRVDEHLWVEVLSWEDGTVVGRLVDGAVHTTEWRKGAHVEVAEAE